MPIWFYTGGNLETAHQRTNRHFQTQGLAQDHAHTIAQAWERDVNVYTSTGRINGDAPVYTATYDPQ